MTRTLAKGDVTRVAATATKFLSGMCDCTVDSYVGTAFSLQVFKLKLS